MGALKNLTLVGSVSQFAPLRLQFKPWAGERKLRQYPPSRCLVFA
jgi:hypothetical protein